MKQLLFGELYGTPDGFVYRYIGTTFYGRYRFIRWPVKVVFGKVARMTKCYMTQQQLNKWLSIATPREL